MTTSKTTRLLAALHAGLLVGLVATAALAQDIPQRLALELEPRAHGKGQAVLAASFSRHLATHLVPMLEGLGYEVTRVHSAKRAIKSGDYHASLAVSVDARPLWLVHEARQYDKTVRAEYDTGVSAWAEWQVFGWREREGFSEGKLGPIDSRVHEARGSGRPLMDDEESVARVFAGELANLAGELFRDYDEPETSPAAREAE